MKGHPVLTFYVYKLVLPELISKNVPSKLQTLGLPMIWSSLDSKFPFRKPTQGWTITQGPLSRAHCFKTEKMNGNPKKQTNKKHMNTSHEHALTPMGTHEHLSTHEHPWTPISNERPWIHMNSSECSWKRLFFQIKCSWQFTCWTTCLTVFKLLCLVFCYASFWCKLFYWTLFLSLCVMYFYFVLCWLCAPESNLLPLLHNMVFDTYIIYIYILYTANAWALPGPAMTTGDASASASSSSSSSSSAELNPYLKIFNGCRSLTGVEN